ncbi:glycosyltransferase family 2 protein [Faecalibaculum rodentium]|uniref:glycosyltransferase family 2 protein n=2 Tax=Faecalibaculum rodentium TaxID=1702221 RepID=UPI0023F359AE|nr:glycosyltransferase family 2 protein [Faecalibaculum rodentium]
MSVSDSGVSVLMPAYNAADYIEKTLQSVINQQYTDYEIVIVDDGSSDTTLKVIEKWQRNFPEKIKIKAQKNSGVSETRNTLLSLARKKYFTFLDSDDYLDSDYLGKLVQAAEENNADMVISGQRKVSNEGELIALIHYPVDQYPGTAMRRLNFAGKLYRREFVQNTGVHFQKQNLYEDNPFNLALMSLADNLTILPYEGYNQIVHVGSITARKITNNQIPYKAIEETVRLVSENKNLIKDYDLFVYTLLSFFVFFIFKANKNHSYMRMDKKRQSNTDTVLKFVVFAEKTLADLPFSVYDNKYLKYNKVKDLPIAQKIGVYTFLRLLKWNLLLPFVKIYYRI